MADFPHDDAARTRGAICRARARTNQDESIVLLCANVRGDRRARKFGTKFNGPRLLRRRRRRDDSTGRRSNFLLFSSLDVLQRARTTTTAPDLSHSFGASSVFPRSAISLFGRRARRASNTLASRVYFSLVSNYFPRTLTRLIFGASRVVGIFYERVELIAPISDFSASTKRLVNLLALCELGFCFVTRERSGSARVFCTAASCYAFRKKSNGKRNKKKKKTPRRDVRRKMRGGKDVESRGESADGAAVALRKRNKVGSPPGCRATRRRGGASESYQRAARTANDLSSPRKSTVTVFARCTVSSAQCIVTYYE